MSRLRSAALVLTATLAIPLLLFVGAGRYVQAQLPPPQGDRVRGPNGLVGVQTAGAWGSAYAWIVPSEHGVIVVDGGLDPAGRALTAEIGQREVQGVLLTQGRLDRVAGLAALPNAPVWADAAAIAAIRGTAPPEGWLARALSVVATPPALGAAPTPLTDPPAVVTIDGEAFRPVRVPGSSPGSVVWQWEGVLFTGDAVHGGSPLSVPPAGLVDDPDLARESLAALLPLDFVAIADANTGLTSAARPALFRLAGQPEAPPSIDAAPSSSTPSAAPAVPTIAVRGVVVRSPAPDVRGERPDLLVTATGQTWRLASTPDAAFDAWVGQPVIVEGRPAEHGEGTGVPLDVVSIAADPPAPPPVTTGPLDERVGQVVRVTGAVTGFRPLARGATWGEGTLAIAGDRAGDAPTSLPLSAPIAAIEGEAIALDVRVVRDTGGGLRLVAFPPSDESEAERRDATTPPRPAAPAAAESSSTLSDG